MTTYTYSEARQKLATVLDRARKEGEILIKRKEGSFFVVKPLYSDRSPFEVDGIDLDIKSEEIIDIIREVRER